MRQLLCVLLCLFYFVFAFSCSSKGTLSLPENYLSNYSALTKVAIEQGIQDEYYVTDNDLQNYVKFRILEGKYKGQSVVLSSISPICWDSIPCLYVLQYERGFEIVSADKRSPVPIARNSRGVFSECDDPDGFGGHLSLMASEIFLSLKGLLPAASQGEEENIQGSLDFWLLINAQAPLISNNRLGSISEEANRGGHVPQGFWEMVIAESEEEVYDSIPHLTTTTWYQTSIYNLYCPEDRDTLNHIERCPAGCVAIAGAQMLYFLHNKDGVPTTSPSEGSCTGYVYDHSYAQNFWNYSISTWGSMSPRDWSDTCAALLVGDVGKRLHMDYAWDGSEASTEDLVAEVFSPYGWNCVYVDNYNSSIIVSSLQSGYPVVCAGHREVRGVEKRGHAFLVDRYKRTRTRTRITWQWIDLDGDPTNNPILLPPDDEFTYSSPHISYYGMNWGQSAIASNNTWCSLSGVWQYGSLSPYIYNRRMIYDFTTD